MLRSNYIFGLTLFLLCKIVQLTSAQNPDQIVFNFQVAIILRYETTNAPSTVSTMDPTNSSPEVDMTTTSTGPNSMSTLSTPDDTSPSDDDMTSPSPGIGGLLAYGGMTSPPPYNPPVEIFPKLGGEVFNSPGKYSIYDDQVKESLRIWLTEEFENATYDLGFLNVTVDDPLTLFEERQEIFPYTVEYDFDIVNDQDAFDELPPRVWAVVNGIQDGDCDENGENEIEPGIGVDCGETVGLDGNTEEAVYDAVRELCDAFCEPWQYSNCVEDGSTTTCLNRCNITNMPIECKAGLGIESDTVSIACSLDEKYEPQFTCSCREDYGKLGVLMSDADENDEVTCYSMTILVIIIGCVGGGIIVILIIIACCCAQRAKNAEKEENAYHEELPERQDAFQSPTKPPPFGRNSNGGVVPDPDHWSDLQAAAKPEDIQLYESNENEFASNGLDRRLLVTKYDNPAYEPTTYQDEAILASGHYNDFRASVINVDPRTEYKIKRPTYHIRPTDDMMVDG